MGKRVTDFFQRWRSLRRSGFWLIIWCMLVVAMAKPLQAQQDPFKRGRRSQSESAAESGKGGQSVENSQTDSSAGANALSWRDRLSRLVLMPPWFRDWQRSLQAKVSETALQIKSSSWRDSWWLYVLGMLLAIGFGFLHIAGPGHGKVFTISYFMSRDASLREGLWLSVLINVVDSLSAGLVVFLTYGVLRLTFHQGQWLEAIVSILSYGIIIVWGVIHLLSHVFGHHHCHSHAHPQSQVAHSECGHKHSHRDHHDHHTSAAPQVTGRQTKGSSDKYPFRAERQSSCRIVSSLKPQHTAEYASALAPRARQNLARSASKANLSELPKGEAGKAQRPAWYFALGIGLIPCPISTALLIFGLLNKMLGVAAYLVIGVSLGGILAMSLLSFAVIGGKHGISALLLSLLQSPSQSDTSPKTKGKQRKEKVLSRLGEAAEMLALLLMVLMGAVFLLLSWPV